MAGEEQLSGTRPGPSNAKRMGFIALVYAVTHGISLLNRGLFWDDWVFWQQDYGVVAEAARSMGSTWPWWINKLYFYTEPGITTNRLITFCALLVAALLFYDLLRRLPHVGEGTAMWAAVLFAVFPVYEARVAMVMVGYALCLALFVAGVWLLVRFSPRPPVLARIGAAALFFASFHTGSLLVFFAVVPVVLLLVDPPESRRLADVARRLLAYADLLVLPVVYWLAKQVFFPPSGLYVGYNQPGGNTSFISDLVGGLINVSVGPVMKAVNLLPLKVPFLVGLGIAVLGMLALRRWGLLQRDRAAELAVAGIALLVLAVLPYAAVGKVPMNEGWDTRHSLLVGFGGALIFVGIAKAMVRDSKVSRAVSVAVLAVMVLGSTAIHIANYIRYERDWLKQQALMEAFGSSADIEGATFIVIDDDTADLDVSRRMFYEYAGILSEVFGEQSRFATDRYYYAGDYDKVEKYNAHVRYYKLADFEGGEPDCVVHISRGELDLRRTSEVLRLMLLDLTDKGALREELASALTIETRPYTEADKAVDIPR